MDSWIYKKLMNQQIENYSLDDCMKLLDPSRLYLHDYDLLCVGYKNNSKQFYQLKILAASPQSKSLQGPHELMVYGVNNNVQFWVWSLTTLRKHFFEFTDRLSFERSSFIILREPQILLRLKCARTVLKMMRKNPQHIQKKLGYDKQVVLKPYESIYMSPCHKVVNRVSIRVREQQKKLLEKSFTSYLREFENTHSTNEQIFNSFRNDILANLDKLQGSSSVSNVEPPPQIPEIEYRTEDLDYNQDDIFELHEIDFCY